jgi:hypothetical protein
MMVRDFTRRNAQQHAATLNKLNYKRDNLICLDVLLRILQRYLPPP